MTVKETAVHDIMDDLKQQCKCFLAFRKDLDSTIEKLVNTYIDLQEKQKDKQH